MPKLYFVNPGEIDIRALTILGVNVKPGASPIGHFGTGVKNAIAGVLRLGGSIRVWSGLLEHRFTAEPEVIRGKEFQVVHMQDYGSDTVLGFTTELAKDWEPWMLYRELRSNALDEGGDVTTKTVSKAEGSTVIEVNCEALWEAHCQRYEFWLDSEPLWKIGSVECHPNITHTLFYHNIKALPAIQEGKQPWMFSWNIVSSESLTEDRTFASVWDIRAKIAKAILQSGDEKVIQTCLTCGVEAELDYDWIGVAASLAFASTVQDLIRAKVGVPASARAAARRAFPKETERAETAEVGDTWEEMLEQAPAAAPEIKASYYEYVREADARIEALEELVAYWRKCAEKLATDRASVEEVVEIPATYVTPPDAPDAIPF